VPGPDSCVKGPCGANPNRQQREGTSTKYSYTASAEAVYRLPKVAINMGGGGESKKHAPVVFRGCFETSTARPDLQHSTGARATIAGGNGFEALQDCARRCQRLHLPFMAMNNDGCSCDNQFGSGGTFQRVPTQECAASSLSLKQCGVGPCGAGSIRNAVYEVRTGG